MNPTWDKKLALIGLAMEELLEVLIRAFRELPDWAKLAVFGVLLLAFIGLALWSILAWRKNSRLRKILRRKEADLKAATEERDQLISRFQALDRVDSHVWTKPDAFQNDRFVPAQQRQTRFIALCNLKGGVGKTTLTLNLGIALAQIGKRVVLVDLDFQGTLSSLALPSDLLRQYRDNGWTSDVLLKAEAEVASLNPYTFPTSDADACKVILARENLEVVEFEQQSRFFVNPEHEVRFLLQKHLHAADILHKYDYVLLDCPPRMSTACINALTCADYILVPTTLSPARY